MGFVLPYGIRLTTGVLNEVLCGPQYGLGCEGTGLPPCSEPNATLVLWCFMFALSGLYCRAIS